MSNKKRGPVVEVDDREDTTDYHFTLPDSMKAELNTLGVWRRGNDRTIVSRTIRVALRLYVLHLRRQIEKEKKAG